MAAFKPAGRIYHIILVLIQYIRNRIEVSEK